MSLAVNVINRLLTLLFELVYHPLKFLGPFWSIVLISCLAGLVMVWIFGKVSNQPCIRRSRNRLSAELIGLRLFKDDLRVFFRIQSQVLIWTVKYFRYCLTPMLILMVPTMFILIQLNLHFGSRPLRVGDQTLVKVRLRGAVTLAGRNQITLTAPENVRIETQGVRIPETKEVCWRIRGISPGRFDLTVSDGKVSATKKAAVGGPYEGVPSMRTGENWFAGLLYPGEALIPSQSPFASIEILYPGLDIVFLGVRANWLILFLLLSLGFGYLVKGALRVEI